MSITHKSKEQTTRAIIGVFGMSFAIPFRLLHRKKKQFSLFKSMKIVFFLIRHQRSNKVTIHGHVLLLFDKFAMFLIVPCRVTCQVNGYQKLTLKYTEYKAVVST